jgi:hypothetical protein
MSSVAQRGYVYVCGVSSTAEGWEGAKGSAAKVVRSFKLRTA